MNLSTDTISVLKNFSDINQNSASSGQVMKWNGSAWVADNDLAGGGASGWVDDGNVVRLDTGTDSVGIGTSSPGEKLEVNGNIRVGGKATIGASHTNTGTAGFVAGQGNSVTANYASVSGGISNTASGANAAINGGNGNNATASFAAIGGGSTNYATGDNSTVGGGEINVAEGKYSSIGGGMNNRTRGDYSTVAGGRQGTIAI